jgi:hypothetical protein
MTGFLFTVIAPNLEITNDSLHERLNNLPFSAEPAISNGVPQIEVCTDDLGPYRGAGRALDALQSLGLEIQNIAIDLVSISDIADRCNVSREAARLWATGERRSDFPTAYGQAGGSALWDWAAVYGWLAKQPGLAVDDLYSAEPLPADIRDLFNGRIAKHRMIGATGWEPAISIARSAAPTVRRAQSRIPRDWTQKVSA